jgi:hypothetical protein
MAASDAIPTYSIFHDRPVAQLFDYSSDSDVMVGFTDTPPVLPLSSDHIGDMLSSPGDNSSRFLFGNKNGLQLSDGGEKFSLFCEEAKRVHVDHIGLAEPNIDDTWWETNDVVNRTVKRTFHHVCVDTATSPIITESLYKPGGTMSMAMGNIVGRIIERGGDYLGRWSFIRYAGIGHRTIMVVSAYQVCVRPTNVHGTTAFHQQQSIFQLERRATINPRKNFQLDLLSALRLWQARGDSIILMGDFNADLHEVTSGLSALIHDSTFGMIDIIGHMHPSAMGVPTYLRGTTRLDFALISRDLIPSVQACGYLPFHSNFRSDHRFLFLDFDTQQLFGSLTSALSPATYREFTSKDSHAVAKYIRLKHKYLTEHNFFARLTILAALDVHDATLAETLDNVLTAASLYAATKCRRKRRDWWSVPLHQELERKSMIESMISGFRTNTDSSSAVKKRLQELDIEMVLPESMVSAKHMLRELVSNIKVIRSTSFSVREKDVLTRLAARSRLGQADEAKVMKAILHKEKQSQRWARISRMQGIKRSKGISSLQIPASWPTTEAGFLAAPPENPKTCSTWRTVSTPAEIEFYIQMRNRLHFGQSQGTPFTTSPLAQRYDWAANSPEAERTLDGEFTPDDLEDLQQLLLSHCTREHETVQANLITSSSFRRRLKRWDERTTTSPSGLHLGHAKALVVRLHVDDTSDEGILLKAQQQELFAAHLSMINYALKHGHSYERWKSIVNVMIEKDPGNTQIHRLRVIHLYEFDLGACMAILWKEMLLVSERRGTINDGQFGGRKGREASNLALAEELKVDICLASRKSLVNFDNDAASCYDRILAPIASLLGRKKGLHRLVTLVHATTLAEARYKLKTALGISEAEYSHEDAFPIYGTGQGSTNSPTIWIIISSTLFDVHMQRANGATFSSPDKSVEIAFSIVGFVDDSNCQTNDFHADPQPSPAELAHLAENDAKLWSSLLWLSGGYLELPKCSYHFIHFQFAPDGTPSMQGGPVGPPIEITDEVTGLPISIPRKSAFDAHKTLGHYKAPAGNSRTQFNVLFQHGLLTATRVLGSPLTPTEAAMYYHAIWNAKMRYVLPQCVLSPRQLRSIENKPLQAFVAKHGYGRTMALAVRYGPRQLGGAGFIQLETLQGEGQILNFLKMFRTDGTISRLVRCALSWGQLQAGIGVPLLMVPTLYLPHYEQRFLASLRDFLGSIDAQLEVDQDFVPARQRVNDFYLMDLAMKSGRFTGKQLKLVNYCRLYLQVVTAADIVLPSGYCLDEWLLDGVLHIDSSATTFVKVAQSRPNKKTWFQWSRLMQLVGDELSRRPLGAWLFSAPGLRRLWPRYLDLHSQVLHVRSADGFIQYVRTPSGDFAHGLADPSWSPTESCVPVEADPSGSGRYFLNDESIQAIASTLVPPVAQTLLEYIDDLPTWDRSLFQWLKLLVDPFELLELCTQASSASGFTLLLVSDGSAGNNSMTFAWVLALPCGKRVATCAGPVFGFRESSYRSEGYGVLSAVRFVYHLFQFCGCAPQWRYDYMADNKGLLTALIQDATYAEAFPNTTLEADWDLRNEIKATLKLIGRPHTFSHVKGHQDSGTSVESLDLPAQLNVEADHGANAFRAAYPAHRPLVPRLGHNRAQLHIGGRTINGKYRQEIRLAKSEGPLRAYIMRKYSWTESQMESIDWKALTRALNRTRDKEVALVKLLAEVTPTATRMNRYHGSTSPKCPRCLTDDETIDHVIRCLSDDCQKWRAALLTHLRVVCTTALHSRLALVDLLLDGLQCWFQHEQLDCAAYPATLHSLIKAQNSIGWNQLFRGRMATEWATLQQQSLVENGCQTPSLSGRSWVATVISTLWTRFFELWYARNQIVHGVNILDYTIIQKSKLLDELKELHSRRASFHRSDLPFLIAQNDAEIHKLDEFVEQNYVSTLRTWLRMWKPTFAAGAKLASAQAVQGTGRIFDHFPVLHRVIRNNDPIQRVRERRRPHTPRVDLSCFHRVTSFFSPATRAPARLGTPLPIGQITEPP